MVISEIEYILWHQEIFPRKKTMVTIFETRPEGLVLLVMSIDVLGEESLVWMTANVWDTLVFLVR